MSHTSDAGRRFDRWLGSSSRHMLSVWPKKGVREPGGGAGREPSRVPGRPLGPLRAGAPGWRRAPPCGVVPGRRPLLPECSLPSCFSVPLPLRFARGASVAHRGSVCLPTGHGPEDGVQTPRLLQLPARLSPARLRVHLIL